MKKHWRLWLLLLFCSGMGLAWFFWPQDPIGPASFRRIQLGMKQHEVEAIVGLPPGVFYTGPRGIGGVLSRGPFGSFREGKGVAWENTMVDRISKRSTVATWWGNQFALQVAFDNDGDAVGVYLLGVTPAVRDATFFQRLRNWLGW